MTQSMSNETVKTTDITNINSTKIDTRPLKIVKIGTEEDECAFTFNGSNLNSALSQVPVGWKVSITSVVSAFRTGKSFLLSCFLQCLNRECSGLAK